MPLISTLEEFMEISISFIEEAYQYAFGIIYNQDQAEEIVAEAFYCNAQQYKTFSTDKELRASLFKVIDQKCQHHLQRISRLN